MCVGPFLSYAQDAVAATGSNQQSQEIAGNSVDLSVLDPLSNETEDIMRQLVENPFELDSFFTDFNGVDVKVSFYLVRLKIIRINFEKKNKNYSKAGGEQ